MPTAATWEFGLPRQEATSTEDSVFGKGPGHYHQQNTQSSGVYVFQETCKLRRRKHCSRHCQNIVHQKHSRADCWTRPDS